MSLNRRKNIYTLGDFHQQHQVKVSSRRQKLDPFERDPFKIQSYNFHYADRPAFPLPTFTSRVTSQTANKRFETFYYNYDFAPTRHDKENTPANKFHEFRRRKFLYDYQQAAPAQPQAPQHARPPAPSPQPQFQKSSPLRTASNTPVLAAGVANGVGAASSHTPNLLRTATSRDYLSGLRPLYATYAPESRYSQQNLQCHTRASALSGAKASTSTEFTGNRSKTSLAGLDSATRFRQQYEISSSGKLADKSSSLRRPSSPQHCRRSQQTPDASAENVLHATPSAVAAATSVPNDNAQRTINAGSGCLININIKGLEDSSLAENVTIKIKSDSSSSVQCRRSTQCIDEYRLHPKSQSQHQQTQEERKQPVLQQCHSDKNQSQTQQQQQQKHQHQHQQQQQQSQHHQKQERQQQQQQHREPHQQQERQRKQSYDGFATLDRSSENFNLNRDLSKSSLLGKVLPGQAAKNKEAKRHSTDSKLNSDSTAKKPPPTRPFVVPNRPSFERCPSLIPWNIPKGLKDCFKEENVSKPMPTVHVVHLSTPRHQEQMRRLGIACNVNAPLTNINTQQQHRRVLKTTDGGGRTATTKTMPMRGEHKLLNTMPTYRNIENLLPYSKCDPMLKKNPAFCEKHRVSSRHSLHTVKESYSKDIFRMNRFSETDFATAGRKHPTIQKCRHNLSPLNVNINVFTDRLKLLRV